MKTSLNTTARTTKQTSRRWSMPGIRRMNTNGRLKKCAGVMDSKPGEVIRSFKTYKAAIKAGYARYVPQGGRETFVKATQKFEMNGLIYNLGDLVEIIENGK